MDRCESYKLYEEVLCSIVVSKFGIYLQAVKTVRVFLSVSTCPRLQKQLGLYHRLHKWNWYCALLINIRLEVDTKCFVFLSDSVFIDWRLLLSINQLLIYRLVYIPH